MSVYVDQPIFPWRGKKWCHLWADTLDELHAFAQALGLRREWFQQPPKASWEHYDLVETRRAVALKRGAIETDKYGPGIFVAERAGQLKRVAVFREARFREYEAEMDRMLGL